MTSTRLTRPYPPDLCSRATLAYRLDVTADTVTEWVRLGHLPPPLEVGTQARWEWDTVRAWIDARNGKPVTDRNGLVDSPGAPAVPSPETDSPFRRGISNVKTEAA